MTDIDYKETIKNMGSSKRLGQNFLLNREVAKTEANFGLDKNVVELGPGLGILTKELCKTSKKVIAIEKDTRLFDILKQNLKQKNLVLLNKDFFDIQKRELSDSDIMISNIPYNLSSKVIEWLSEMQMPALLCLQKEFVEHMLANPGERSYSKLSVISKMFFHVTLVMDVPLNDFYPTPRIASAVVLLKPKKVRIRRGLMDVVSLLMMHKKKKLRNALIDSCDALGIGKEEAFRIAGGMPNGEKRALHMQPEDILKDADYVLDQLRSRN